MRVPLIMVMMFSLVCAIVAGNKKRRLAAPVWWWLTEGASQLMRLLPIDMRPPGALGLAVMVVAMMERSFHVFIMLSLARHVKPLIRLALKPGALDGWAAG
ncbi:hypothetical protein C2134_18510 [Chromobacterium sinusclupearum]|uniref:Uncharacterized protein n=1 Tax=Chromobacterium sinusclupearum TaxID=2077146 RepID=A0A2K4MJE2_9NEIS|nr:hypothetical protein C2134_18510 [Chromobacterium sinusclupearum]